MKRAEIPLPELGLIAGTRGMLGAGIGLLLGERLSAENRRKFGWGLLIAGLVSTLPLALDLWRRRVVAGDPSDASSEARYRTLVPHI